MNIITDSSSQSVITTLPTITGNYNFFVTSNDLYPSFYNRTATDTLLATKQPNLTAGTNLVGIGSSITQLNWNNITLNVPSTFPPNMTNIYSKTETDNLLSAKESILTFSAPLTRSTNTIGINLTNYAVNAALSNFVTNTTIASYSTTAQTNSAISSALIPYATNSAISNFITSSALTPYLTSSAAASTYLALTANQTLTGDLTFNKNNLNIQLTSTNGNNIAIPSNSGFFSTSAAPNDMVIRSLQTMYLQTGGLAHAIKIPTTNIVEIPSLTSATSFLYKGTELSTTLANKENTLTFNSPLTRTTNTIGIDLSAYSTTTVNNSTYLRLDGSASMTSKLLLLTGGQGNPSFATNNGGGGDRIVFQSGIAGSVLPYSIGYSLNNLWMSVPSPATINTYVDGSIKWSVGSTGALLYGNLNSSNIQENGINLDRKYTTNVALNSCNYLSSASLGNYVLKAGDTMTGTLTGTIINANTSLRIANNLVNDFCFNNLGFNHADITDFNAVVGFGCRFIFGNTNGPSVNYGAQTSSYSLFMGLGINYPASGLGSYGCQLALQRSVTNPTLSVRYKENNNWGSWSGITADVARTLNGTATFTVNTWHRSSDNQQRLYFENNTTTFIQGQGTFPIIFRNNANADIGSVSSTGIINANLKLQEAGVDISTKYLALSGGTLTGALNFTGNNGIKFDNTFNEKKIEMSTTSGMGLATNGLVFYSSGAFTFKNTALTTLYSVGSDGSMSTNGTMYPAGGVSSAGNITSFGTLAGVTITEGGTSLASKYVLLNGGNNMTGNLNIVNSGSDRSVRISATSIEALNANGSANRLLAIGNSGGIAMGGYLSYGITTARHAIDMYNASILIRGSSEASQAILYICNPYLQDSALKTAIIAQGISSWSRSKLCFCLNSTADNTTSATIADAKLTIDTNGNVGIGNTSPGYPLVVSGTAASYTITSMSRRYDEVGSIGNSVPYTMTGIVAYINGNVLTPGFYVSFSDERLKKEIEELSNDFALQTIMKLKPIKYNLIDNICNNNTNYGFSAQEVQKVLPEAVICAKHYLPNIFQNVDGVDNNNSNIMINPDIIGSNLNINDNIKIVTHSNEEQIKKIVNINSNIITLDSKIDNYNDGDPVFLYGKEQEDIKCVNHNFLYNVNIKATQVLYEIIMKQQEEIIKLTNVLISSNIISPL